ncbi:MAG: putative membrane protein [Rhodothermales bacterium]|jgi:putative membrane protein
MISFSNTDLEAVKKAVKAAEGQTAGEIVPFVSLRSDRYDIALWRAAGLFALIGIALVLAAEMLSDGWGTAWLGAGGSVAAIGLVSGGFGWLLAYSVDSFRRLMAGDAAMTLAVHRKAKQAFLDEEVFDTVDRTGILLFVSLFERRIEVVGDSGINAKVSSDDWVDVIGSVREGIRQGQVAQGIVEGIARCGALLNSKGVALKPDDTNELPDGLRLDTE